MAEIIESFPPVIDQNCHALLLGTMPGRESLKAHQYYAKKQNAFWKIMAELTGAAIELNYEEKLTHLKSAGIALWDVIHRCERENSSLDSKIRNAIPNNFQKILMDYPNIRHIFFNGNPARKFFDQLVLKDIDSANIKLHVLPSTSPAHAGMTFAAKLEAWRVILEA